MKSWMDDWHNGLILLILAGFCIGIVGAAGAVVWWLAYDVIGLGPKSSMLLGWVIPAAVAPVLLQRALRDWFRTREAEITRLAREGAEKAERIEIAAARRAELAAADAAAGPRR